VDAARKAGADAAEAFITTARKSRFSSVTGPWESLNASSEAGIGIRVLKDQKMIFGSSNELAKTWSRTGFGLDSEGPLPYAR